MNIRRLKKEDAPQVAVLIKQLTENIVEPENLLKRLEDLSVPQNFQYLTAEIGGVVVGFAGLAWYVIPSKGQVGWIEEVVVDEKYRGQGIAGNLMQELLKVAEEKGLKQVKLTTANPAAKHLYEKLGFIKKEEELLVKKYY